MDDETTEDQTVTQTDDGGVEVELDQPLTLPAAGDLETFNLIPLLKQTPAGEKFLKEVADRVIEDFESAWDSTADYREWRAILQKLFLGNVDPKDYPFEDAANVHLAFMAQALMRLHARAVTALFPRDGAFFHAIPTTVGSKERVQNVGLYMTWELRTLMTDFVPQQDKGLLECWIVGSVFYHSTRDMVADRNRHDYLTCEDFFMPYASRSCDPSLSDVPYKGRILRRYQHQLEAEAAAGIYDQDAVEELLEGEPGKDMDKKPVQDVQDDADGTHTSPDGITDPWRLVEYHGYCQLPGENRQRAVCITVERDSGKPLSFYVREEEDWRDKIRFDRETATYQQQTQQFSAWQDHMDNRNAARQFVQDPTADEATKMQAGQMLMQPEQPQPPVPQEPKPCRLVAIEYFTHVICEPNPFGAYGIGVGRMLAGFNMAGDTIASQFTDAATWANAKTGIASKGAGLPEGDITIAPGDIIKTDLPPELAQHAITWITPPPANPQMMELVMMLDKAAQGMASAPDVYGGEPGKSNETWRGITTRVQEANKQLTALVQRYTLGLTEILKKHARLNSKFLPDSQYQSVLDEKQQPVGITVARTDFLEDFHISFTADPRMASDAQVVGEADELLQMIMGTAKVHQSQGLVILALKNALEARRRPDMVQALQDEMKAKAQQNQPPPTRSHIEEDADYLKGKDSPVNQADNHQQHIDGHEAFMSPESQLGAKLAPEMKKALEQHIRNHVAAIMLALQKEMQNATQGGPGGPFGLAGASGDGSPGGSPEGPSA